MNRNAAALVERAGAYARLFDRVSAGGRFDGASSAGPVRLSTDDELRSIGDAWLRWASEPDAWFIVPNGELLCRA